MSDASETTVGVLALQGDVELHRRSLERCGVAHRAVRTLAQIDACHGLIIPGGESSTVGILLERYDMMAPLRQRIRGGMPVYGTCMGLIVLAEEIEGSKQPRLGVLHVAVRRNAFGRQIDSFAERGRLKLGEEVVESEMVFIRAPRIRRIGPGVEVIGTWGEEPVLVRQGRVLGATFHPEMSPQSPFPTWFVGELARSVSASRPSPSPSRKAESAPTLDETLPRLHP